MEEDDDWVVVKKQRITILIPPSSPGQEDNKIKNPIQNKNEQPKGPERKPISTQNTSSLSGKGLPISRRAKITPLTFEPLVRPLKAVSLGRRARNLERRLEKLGGLSRYIASLRLSRFVDMKEMEMLDKFQLAGLTMEKLKEMGTYEVGPRRKLLHAIECLCQDSTRVGDAGQRR